MGFEPLTQDEILGISTAVEASYNTNPVTAALYSYFYCRSATLPNPDKEKFDNTGFIGLQQEGATVQRSGFVTPPSFQFASDVDTGIWAKFARRALGKADPTPAGGDIISVGLAFKHHFALLGNHTAAGRQLPSSSLIASNGNLDYIYTGVVMSQLQFAQTGADTPQVTVDAIGSGGYVKVSSLGGFGSPTVPADNTAAICDGAETEVEYTHTAGTKFLAKVNAAAPQVLKSINVTAVNNALDTADRRAGAKRLVSADPNAGWILSYLLHGNRTAQGEFRVGVGQSTDTADELIAALNDEIITAFHFRMFGDIIDVALPTTARHTVDVIFDKAYFRNVRRASDNGAEFVDVAVFPVSSGSSTDPDFVRIDLVNGVATAIV